MGPAFLLLLGPELVGSNVWLDFFILTHLVLCRLLDWCGRPSPACWEPQDLSLGLGELLCTQQIPWETVSMILPSGFVTFGTWLCWFLVSAGSRGTSASLLNCGLRLPGSRRDFVAVLLDLLLIQEHVPGWKLLLTCLRIIFVLKLSSQAEGGDGTERTKMSEQPAWCGSSEGQGASQEGT